MRLGGRPSRRAAARDRHPITGGGGGAVILDPAERLLGIVTDGDVRRALQRCEPARLGDLRARDVMTAQPITVAPDAMAYDALRLMEDRPSQIHVLPVVAGERCVASSGCTT